VASKPSFLPRIKYGINSSRNSELQKDWIPLYQVPRVKHGGLVKPGMTIIIMGLMALSIEVCELHDAFAVNELQHYVELGFCKRGEEARLIEDGITEIGGKLPVNPSGGLLSKGHPISASGIAQVAEIVWQLRGQAGKRQVANARVGLAHVAGGEVAGLESGAVAVHILKM